MDLPGVSSCLLGAFLSNSSNRGMAFPPPRPPLQIPGLPPLPPMMPPPYGVPGMVGMIPMTMGMMAGHLMTPVTMAVAPPPLPLPSPPKPLIKKPVLSQRKNVQDKTRGPPVTVFVGNITERATDSLIRQILQRCGTVINWKRVQGANGRLQAFGFCEYGDPESALRAIRLLHEWEIGDKKLVVKVDAKTKEKLDEYKASKSVSEKDTEMWEEDTIVKSAIQYLLHEHGAELTRNNGGPDNKDKNKKINRTQEALLRISQDGDKNNLDEMDLEEEKKSLITREIDKFRDTYKRAEEEKEKERRERRDRRSGSKEHRPESPSPAASAVPNNTSSSSMSESSKRAADQRRGRETDTNRLDRDGSRTERERAERERERERQERERLERERERDRSERSERSERERSERDRERERQSDRERDRASERERERSERSRAPPDTEDRTERQERRSRSRSPRERETTEWKETRDRETRGRSWEREREEEEEVYERKKLERKLREKEAAYKERLRNWEIRERRKIKEYEKEKLKEAERKYEELKEARRLKEFLEDYDDDRDDPKYYKGSALARRLKEREKEAEADSRDRHKEREELEELRRKLAEEGHPDPVAEAKRLQQEEDCKFQSAASPVSKLEEQALAQQRSLAEEEDNSRDVAEETGAHSPSASPYTRPSRQEPNRGHSYKNKEGSSSDQDEDEEDSRSGPTRRDHEPPHEERGERGKWHEQERMAAGDDSTQNSMTSGFSDMVPASTPREENKPMGFAGLKLGSANTANSGSPLGPARSPNLPSSNNTNHQQQLKNKKKKMTVEEAFNTQEDDGADSKKRRRLIPLNDSSDGVASNNDDSNSGVKGGSLQHLTTDEKRQHIKNLIDKIPTTKDELFAYSIDWSLVDSSLMERRIRPWINKKIVEYIGEEEPTLVEFICSKVMVGSSAKSILEDVFMVLDEEAEVFVVKMWRLLIYEIEAKKLGIMKL